MPAQRDPTLESNLIERVKTTQDSAALTSLVTLHSGIYFSVVNRYAQVYPNIIHANDLADDQYYNMYRFVRDYNPERRTKLSTYIHDRTNYLCKTMLRDDKRNPLSGAVSLSGCAPTEETNDNQPPQTIVIMDEHEDVVEAADKDLKIEDIMKTARHICVDERFITILQYRHFNTSSAATSLSWRQIGRLLNLSYEGARKIYLANLDLVKREMSGRVGV